jgi:hypothetical protein
MIDALLDVYYKNHSEKKMNEEDDENFKKSLKLIDEWGEKNKPSSLRELLMKWYETKSIRQSKDDVVDELCDIVSKWLPKENPNPRIDDQWSKCVKHMRNQLK